MSLLDHLPEPSAPWHALLAPLPDDVVPARRPVAPGAPAGGATEGWEALVVDISAGAAGLRAVQVVLDQDGQAIAVSDHVLYRIERSGAEAARVEYQHESIGGRLEDDGSFNGTRWRSASVENEAGDELESASQPSPPSDDDIAGVRALVADVLRRAPASDEA